MDHLKINIEEEGRPRLTLLGDAVGGVRCAIAFLEISQSTDIKKKDNQTENFRDHLSICVRKDIGTLNKRSIRLCVITPARPQCIVVSSFYVSGLKRHREIY